MAIYVKVGGIGSGSWRQVADGQVRVKRYGEGHWTYPSKVYVKIGDIGGGYWRDTGYASYPNPPSTPWVHYWDYSNVQAAWHYAAAGGAPISYYDVQLLDYYGNYWTSEASGDNISPMWGIGMDKAVRIRVRSVAVNGLASPWSAELRIATGHPETYNYGWVERSRYWEGGHTSGWRNMDDPWWAALPGRVYLTGMHWRNLYTPQSSVISRGTNRTINFFLENADWGPVSDILGTMYNGHSYDYGFGNWGTGALWGIVPRGAGWSTTGNTHYMCHCDLWFLSGTEYYDNWEHVSTNPGQGNYYW